MDKNDLKKTYLSLTEEQKKVLDGYIKRGLKTKWLNSWAEKLGSVLTEEELDNPDKTIESLLEWQLIEYEDNIIVDGNLKCECGRSLRRRYTILHKPTGKIYKLGVIHFEQHTDMSPEMVRLITKGLQKIDLEKEELLEKVKNKWRLPFSIPFDMPVPNDMADQLRVKLPLLNRQEKRLQVLLNEYKEEQEKELERKRIENINPIELIRKLQSNNLSDREAKDLYDYLRNKSSELKGFGISIGQIKQATTRALGHTRNTELRRWLVEIEYL
ncbi:MAG: hypothetical protein Q8920_04235 [Bacillota bacterium]|nr:hypothetical protein [Bacillota bacterium]